MIVDIFNEALIDRINNNTYIFINIDNAIMNDEHYYRHTEDVLCTLSNISSVVLIALSKRDGFNKSELIKILGNSNIKFDYINENPEVDSKFPYYDILIDTRTGFNPEYDWSILRSSMKYDGLDKKLSGVK